MNIAGLSPQSFTKVNTLLKEVGKAIDPNSPGKATITEAEAGKIVDAFQKLNDGEKAVVGKALQQLFQQDIFTVDSGARASIAKALGVEAKNLEPTAPAGPGVRSVMKAAMQALTRPVGVDKKTFEEVQAGLKGAPRAVGDFVMAALKGASEDGNIKMDGDARREFTKEFAARDQDGAVSWIANKFGEEFASKMPPLALSMLSNPPFFEEIIAALMITVVSKTNNEIIEEQAKIDGTLKADTAAGNAKKAAQTDAIKKDLAGGDTSTPPSTDKPTPGPVQPGPGGGKLASTKGKLEAVVSSIDARMKDGFISKEDSVAIRAKLDRFDKSDPVTKLLAEAMGTAMQHSGLLKGKIVSERLEPITSWVKEVTGTLDFPPPKGFQPGSNLGRALSESDRIEQKLAGFLVEAFIAKPEGAARPSQSSTYAPQGDGATRSAPGADSAQVAQTTIKKFQPLLEQVIQQAAPQEAAATVQKADSRFEKSDGGLYDRFSALADARDKLPPGAIEGSVGKTVDRHAAGLEPGARQALKDGIKTGLESLPKGKCTDEQKRAAFEKATGKAVEYVDKTLAPDELEAKTALVGGAVDKALERANERIFNTKDSGKTLSPAEQKKILQEELGKAKADLVKQAKAAGYDDAQAASLATVFEAEAGRSVERFEKSGKIEPTNPRGAGADTTDPSQTDDTRSRQLMFEKLKFKMNMLSEIMQAMSNILNTMHQNAETTIRAIR